MREVHARTRPGEKVWDGVGHALRREPAYRFWFLPELARQLVYHRHAERYRVEDVLRDPPAAVIADHNALVWLGMQRDLQRVLVRHYLPVWRNLWIPAPNARLDPGQAVEWIVPADGDYRLFASPALAQHPWFRRPVFVSSYHEPDAKRFEVRLGAPTLASNLEGIGISLAPVMRLRKGQRIGIRSRASTPIGVLLVPGRDALLFRQPPIGATLEGATSRVTHLPRLW
jgi:hypothetical protein